MAISIISQPNKYQSGYNPIKYVIDSTNKNKPGFRYIVQIFDEGTANLLAEFDVAPDPFDNGRGKIDISRIIQNKLDKFLSINSTSSNHALTTYYEYDIKFGESFSSDWSFTDYGFNNTFIGGNTGLFQSPQVTPHSFVVGDQVYVQTLASYSDNRSSLTGYFTVIGVVNAYDIVISLNDVGSFPTTPGTVRYADFRKVRTLAMTNILNRVAINTALSVNEYAATQGNMSFYISSGATQALLTNLPDNNKIYPFQYLFLNNLEESGDLAYVYFENDQGDILRKANVGSFPMKANSIGPGNPGLLSVVSGSTPLVKPDVKYYDVWFTDVSGTQLSEKKRINITDKCPINETQIVFMDRKGSFMSFAFPLRMFEEITTQKDSYRKYVDSYTTLSQGNTVYQSVYNKKITLNTDYLTDEHNIYFEELLTSPYTYIRIDGVWYSCTVEDGTYQTERSINKRLIKRQVTVSFDLDAPVNI